MKGKCPLFDLTVDIGVLMIAFGASNLRDTGNACSRLARKLNSLPHYLLAWDDGGLIKNQYEEKLKNNTGYMYWLAQLAKKNKIKPVTRIHVNRGTVAELVQLHFDSSRREDFKYVQTAGATECKILVSRDPDYSRGVRRILRKNLSVVVRQAQACLDLGDR